MRHVGKVFGVERFRHGLIVSILGRLCLFVHWFGYVSVGLWWTRSIWDTRKPRLLVRVSRYGVIVWR